MRDMQRRVVGHLTFPALLCCPLDRAGSLILPLFFPLSLVVLHIIMDIFQGKTKGQQLKGKIVS